MWVNIRVESSEVGSKLLEVLELSEGRWGGVNKMIESFLAQALQNLRCETYM